MMRLKYLARLVADKTVPGNGRPHIDLENVQSGATMAFSYSADTDGRGESLLAQRGDVLISKLRPYLRKVIVAPEELTCSGEFLVLRPRHAVDPRFLAHVLASVPVTNHLVSRSYGTKMPRASWSDLGEFRVQALSIDEQRAVARRLDEESAQVSTLVTRIDRLRAVTREAAMRYVDDALSARPATNRRLRFGLRAIQQGWSPECDDRRAEPGEWGVLKLGCVNYAVFRPDEHKALPKGVTPRHQLEVRPGDLLISRANTRALVGSAAIVRDWRPRLMLSDLLYRLVLDAEVWHPPYVEAVLNSPLGRQQIEAAASGSAGSMPKISQAIISDLTIPHLPLPDQIQVADMISEKRAADARIDRRMEAMREAVIEYRDALAAELLFGSTPAPVVAAEEAVA